MKVYSSCLCGLPLDCGNNLFITGFQIAFISKFKFSLVICNYSVHTFAVFAFTELRAMNKVFVNGCLDIPTSLLPWSKCPWDDHHLRWIWVPELEINWKKKKQNKTNTVPDRAERREKRNMAEVSHNTSNSVMSLRKTSHRGNAYIRKTITYVQDGCSFCAHWSHWY